MKIIAIGLNHKKTPIEIREKLFFPDSSLSKPLSELKNVDGIRASLILSTCNRTEIYAHVNDESGSIQSIKQFLSDCKNFPLSEFEPFLYSYFSKDALVHIFRVASSLDSLVVGEPQILGQFKKSFSIASETGTIDQLLMNLMNKAIETAKIVRTETTIGKSATSVSSCAVELAEKIFGKLDDKSVMIIGAGEMAELAIEHFVSDGIAKLYVVNRSYDKAESIASKYGGIPIKFDDYNTKLSEVDIIITSTGAPRYLIKTSDIKGIMRSRKYKPIFLIDISVPRNIEPDINTIDNAYVYDVDDLKIIVDANMKQRINEIGKAEKIIEKQIFEFINWYNSLAVVPTIKLLREKFEKIRQEELSRVLKKSGNNLGEVEKSIIESFSVSFMNKLLHEPLVNLKELSENDQAIEHVKITQKLFNIKG
jgi:glutamyl-tRNA reductase